LFQTGKQHALITVYKPLFIPWRHKTGCLPRLCLQDSSMELFH